MESQCRRNIELARNGDEIARQNVIKSSRPYIINAVGHVCGKYVTWSDDEASIGLLAFNKAIDSYDPGKGNSFLSYAFCLIKRDLLNYLRKNKSHEREISLDSNSGAFQNDCEFAATPEEIDASIRKYERELESIELAGEISEFDAELNEYGIKLEDLEKSSPKHRDTRELLRGIVNKFLKDEALVSHFIEKKTLPATAFAKSYGYSVKTIEKHRKYIAAMIILKMHPEWEHLAYYAR